MRRLVRAGAAVVCVLGIAGASLASAGSRDASDDGTGETIRLRAREVDSVFMDLGDGGFSLGDQYAFTNDLLRGGSKVGEDGGLCVVTRLTAAGASTFKCVGSNDLPGGQITVQGLVTYGPTEEVKEDPYLFAITGGTGRYRTARGEVRVEELGGGRLRLTFRISR
ncbi:MAG: allene oxide cyclase barrel-like domain-containing protein [Actinomycetota bacterium]